MPAKITLKIIRGKLVGKEYPFDGVDSIILGRASDCSVQLPDDTEHNTISRHHCLIDINPPDARIRDFGSRNGTYLNNQKIGQRAEDMTPEQGAGMKFLEHDLQHGDEIKLGETVFRLNAFVPVKCLECTAEIAEEKKVVAERAPGVYQCEVCRQKAVAAKRVDPPQKKSRRCTKCGRDMAAEAGANREGDVVCAQCQKDPLALVKALLHQAQSSVADLRAISGYSIVRELGRGGMGAVYLARHDRSGEQVALKVMLPQVATDAYAKKLFEREVQNTQALRHGNIVSFREAGEADGMFYFTLDYCEGGSADRLAGSRGGRLPVGEAVAFILDVLAGLDYAHQAPIPNVRLKDGSYRTGQGLVHRDLSPHNILLSKVDGKTVAKIADFGIGKAFDTAGLSGHTRTGSTAGKPWYLPRQQVINYKHAKPEVDVWAAAASLYNLLTGETPRDFPPGRDVWKQVLESQPVPIRRRNSSIPARLAEVIDAALVDKPAIGFTTAAALKKALEGAV